jgi:NitT/TauT family transport system substrate-binding protein
MRTHLPRSLIAAGLMLVIGACSPTAAPSQVGGGLERTELRVGTLPIADVAPVHIAISEGLFAAEGLTVITEITQGGAAAIPALVSGDLDIAYGAWPSFLLANNQGIELRAVADGVAAAPGFTEFLALPASGLEGDPAGMAGKTIAVNTLNNIGELAVRTTLTNAGVNPDDVQLVEIPFPDMAATLERGDVDVIWASEPVATVAKSSVGAIVVADSFVGDMEGFPVAGYQATADFAAEHPRTIAAFQRAMASAAEMARSDSEMVKSLLPGFTSLTPELAADIALPEYRGALDASVLRRVQDTLLAFGILDSELDIESLVLPSG